jgi:hypothetical protein
MAESEFAVEPVKETTSVERYDGTNFQLWKQHMTFIFQSRELFDIVSGKMKKSNCRTPKEKARWEKQDKSAIVAVLSAVDKIHRQEVINCSTSFEMWTQLTSYHQQHSEECIISLQEKYYSCRLGENDSIAVFISIVQKLARELTDLGQTITERQVISKIRCGLPPSYESLMLAWDSVPIAEQTLQSFQTRLAKRESQLRERSDITDVQAERAFFTKSTFHNTSCGDSSKKKSLTTEQKKHKAERLAKIKRHSRCNNCGEKGHFANECPAASDSSRSVSPVKKSRYRDKKHKKKSHANMSASVLVESSTESLTTSSSEAFCISSALLGPNTWIADSGATEHITDKRKWFSTFESIPAYCWSVIVAGNEILWIRGIGDIIVHSTVNYVTTLI